MIDHAAVIPDVPLAPLTTYKVGGSAKWFAEPGDLEELRSILSVVPRDTKLVVLGRGSNVVISDEGIDGLVLRLGGAFGAIDTTRVDSVVAGGGAALAKLARTAGAAGKSGLEFYVGIPGSVGGAVRMNAGGHGSDTASVLIEAIVVDLTTAMLSVRSATALELAYRHSNIVDSEIVVQATFATTPGDPDAIEETIRSITRWRREHQPGGTLNAGSVFKNPADEAAGAIIERCGLKGSSSGAVGISDVHANFLVATPDASALDIYRFVFATRDDVHRLTGILLEPEIRFLGSFDPEGET